MYDQSTINDTHYANCHMYVNETENVCMLNDTPLCAQNDMLNLGLQGKGMHIGHLNIRGIRSKIDELKLFLPS